MSPTEIIDIMGKPVKDEMKEAFSQGKVLILNVHNGVHWVLTTGLTDTDFLVNDPGYNS